MYDAKKELEKHRAKYGTRYTLPDGRQITIKDIEQYLKDNNLVIKQPKEQPTREQLENNVWYL